MHPNLDHFIVRPEEEDGTPGPIVPLVAIDQLPDWLQLVDVPRELDAEQTIGLTNLGVVDKEDGSIWEVRLRHDKIQAILSDADVKTGSNSSGSKKNKAKAKRKTKKRKKVASHTEIKGRMKERTASEESLSSTTGNSSSTERGLVEKPQPRVHPAERMLSASRHNVANTAVTQARNSGSERPLRPHETEAIRDECRSTAQRRTTKRHATVFCRHWCHHGTCKWGPQCRHQHRMPTTLEGLLEVGLKGFPTWYLLMMSGASAGGFPGLFNMNSMLNALSNEQSPAQYPVVQPSSSRALNQHHIPGPPQHSSQPSPLDLSLMQDRMSALLASSNEMNNQQKLEQAREMRHHLPQGTYPAQQPHSHHLANLYTNASLAANVANIQRQTERQQQAKNDRPVATRVKARVMLGDGLDGNGHGGVRLAGGARSSGHNSGDACAIAGRDDDVEEKLLDI